MKNKIFKSVLFWFLALLAGHLASSVIFGLALNTMVATLWHDGYESNAAALASVYGVVAQILFAVVYTVINTRGVEYREKMKAEIRNKTTVFGIFKKFYLKNAIYEIPVYFVFMLPYTLFFAFQTGVDLSNSFSFEKFYISEMWAYITTKNAVFGLLISVISTFLILSAVRLIVVAATRKSLIENSVTLM